MAVHMPAGYTSYRMDGRLPMLLGDMFTFAGRPMCSGGCAGPCMSIEWVTASTTLIVKGRPALTIANTGLCLSAIGAPNGPAVITRTQTGQREPETRTTIHD